MNYSSNVRCIVDFIIGMCSLYGIIAYNNPPLLVWLFAVLTVRGAVSTIRWVLEKESLGVIDAYCEALKRVFY